MLRLIMSNDVKPYDIKSGFAIMYEGKLYQFPTESEANEFLKDKKRA